MGQLSEHPAIVTVYDAGSTESGHPYLTMAYVPGGSLQDDLDQGATWPWSKVLALGVRMSGALEAAHQAGVLHRDIKPANILSSKYGPQLADFGIARVAGGHETGTGIVTATIAHAPPEILDGVRPSAASDIYSLGSTLYAMLAGRPPFMADREEESVLPMIVRIHADQPPDLRQIGVPDAVADVMEGCLSKSAEARPQRAVELGRELQALQRQMSVEVTPLHAPDDELTTVKVEVAPPREPRPRPDSPVTRRRDLKLSALAVGLVALLASGWWWSTTLDRQADDSTAAETTPNEGAEESLQPSSDPAQITNSPPPDEQIPTPSAVASASAAPPDVLSSIDVGTAAFSILSDPIFDLWAPASGPAALVRIDPSSGQATGQVPLGGVPETPVRAGASNQLWVTLISSNQVVQIDPVAEVVTATVEVGANPFIPAVTDDALWVPNRDDGTLSRIDISSRRVTDTVSVGENPRTPTIVGGAAWVSNGDDGTLSRVDLDRREVTDTVPIGGSPSAPVFFDGTLWLATSEPSRVVQVDPASAQILRDITVSNGAQQPVVGGGALWVANRDAGALTQIRPDQAIVEATFDIGGRPMTPAVIDGALWVPDRVNSTVSRFDLEQMRVTGVVEDLGRPDTPVAGPGGVWVTDIENGRVVLISTR